MPRQDPRPSFRREGRPSTEAIPTAGYHRPPAAPVPAWRPGATSSPGRHHPSPRGFRPTRTAWARRVPPSPPSERVHSRPPASAVPAGPGSAACPRQPDRRPVGRLPAVLRDDRAPGPSRHGCVSAGSVGCTTSRLAMAEAEATGVDLEPWSRTRQDRPITEEVVAEGPEACQEFYQRSQRGPAELATKAACCRFRRSSLCALDHW